MNLELAGKTALVTGSSRGIGFAIARSLVSLLGERLSRASLASISPLTSGTLEELGYPVAAEAETYTIPGLVEAIST